MRPVRTISDGSANAPAGPAQHPTFLTGYVKRPPWKVAGVDYAVGPRSNPTKEPQTISMAGVSVDPSWRSVIVSGNDVTLSGYDFSLHSGYQLVVHGANCVVTDCVFAVLQNTGYHVIAADGAALTVQYCSFDGAGKNNDLAFVHWGGSGLFTFIYNWAKNFPNHVAEFVQPNPSPLFSVIYQFNLIEQGAQLDGSHLNYLQFGGGHCTSADVEFNTTYQTPQISGGEGFQFYYNNPGGAGALNGPDVVTLAFNTMISRGGAKGSATSYFVHGGGLSTGPTQNGSCHDNYMDATAGWGFFYGDERGWSFSGNVDMVTGKIVHSNNTKS